MNAEGLLERKRQRERERQRGRFWYWFLLIIKKYLKKVLKYIIKINGFQKLNVHSSKEKRMPMS